ncbi:MAG: DUF2612 domain-containing protein [Pseudomonadota bacterium]
MSDRVEERMGRIISQYAGAEKLQGLIRAYLEAIDDPFQVILDIQAAFDLDSATGDQLTLIGRRMGFPRTQEVCEVPSVFGFEYPTEAAAEGNYPIGGFGSGAGWLADAEFTVAEITVRDSEYRKLLKCRRYQMNEFFDIDSLRAAIQDLWGDTAKVYFARRKEVVVGPGRELTDYESGLLEIYARAIPVALGMDLRFSLQTEKIFGFGTGWSGFIGDTGVPIQGGFNKALEADTGTAMQAEGFARTAPWLQRIQPNPFGCNNLE